MNVELPVLDYSQLGPTRDYLKDIARVIGKAQQTFVPADVHDWQRGLDVTDGGIATKQLPDTSKNIVLDMQDGVVRADGREWTLGEISAPDLMADLTEWLREQGISKQPEQPDYTRDNPVYDESQSQAMSTALNWAADVFETFKQTIGGGTISPVLVYPHHFDLSLVWFPYNDQNQLGFGFSFGDEYIAEPYFYVTAWPEPRDFGSIALEAPAYWHSEGFHGAVLRYRDLLETAQPRDAIETYTAGMLQGGKKLFDWTHSS